MSTPRILKDIEDLKQRQLTMIDSQLTGKYYVPSYSNIVGTPIVLTASPLPTTWTTTGYTIQSGQYQVTSSVAPSGANPLSQAFNGNSDNAFIALVTSSIDVTITLPSAISVVSFKTYIVDKPEIDNVFIKGSNDNSKWDNLYFYNSLDDALTIRNLTTTGEYKYYRFTIEVSAASTIEIKQIQLNTYSIQNIVNVYEIENIPNPLSLNQRIMIKTPAYDPTGITSNTLNGDNIDMLLLPNRYYELVYDGNQYLAKEVI